VPWALALVLFAIYTAISVLRHVRGLSTAYDLGIFEQVIRAYSELRAPISELKGPGYHILGDHFHPVLVLLAPFYKVFPSPITLVVVQAALIAVSVVPLIKLGTDLVGRRFALAVGLAYGLSWGVQQAVAFDFHELAFAVPLLMMSLVMIVRRRPWQAVWWALPLLLVKEDQAITVAAIGVVLFVMGWRRLGLGVIALAVVVGVVVIFGVIPAFNPNHVYPYLHSATDTTAASANPLARFFTPVGRKGGTVFALVILTLFVGLRSPIALIAIPLVASRFWADKPEYWGQHYHYSLLLMPVLFVALVDGVARTMPRVSADVCRRLVRGTAVASLATALVFIALGQPVRGLLNPDKWRVPASLVAAQHALAVIPDGASVAAANTMATQLTGRCQVYLFPMYPRGTVKPEWVVVNDSPESSPVPEFPEAPALASLPDQGYQRVGGGGGISVYHLTQP
jgi:uncharacterized membrane protein